MERESLRSDCPVNYALEYLGDKWTLLIIRDLVFDKKRFFKEFLESKEGIATNILSDRLKRLERLEVIESKAYEKQKKFKVYSLTEKGIDLIPMILEIMIWSTKYKDGLNIDQSVLKKMKEDRESVIKLVRENIEEANLQNT